MHRKQKLALAAVCVCMVAGGILLLIRSGAQKPNPAPAQVVNPLMQVASREEMERYLDFAVPVLDKAVARYTVLVLDGYPTQARIAYEDGADFNMKYGTGDVSGIYGGSPVGEQTISGTKVTFYRYDTLRYALWETGGFTCSLTGGENLSAEVAALLP